MIDFREYKDVIRSAVKKADEKDENWKWSVKSVGKETVKISWGYLKELGEDGAFSVSEIPMNPEMSEEIFLKGKDPSGNFKVYVVVADNRWSDTKSVEDGIAMVIGSLASKAMSVY